MKLSVSITTYNHEPYIRQALDGVLAQEVDFDYEVIVGDDCSNDGTREIVRDYAAKHPALIRAVLPERNLGGGGKHLFSQTLSSCRGSYIAFMDGDDYWTSPRKLALQAQLLDARPDVSMCFHNVLKVSEPDGKVVGPYNTWGCDREIVLDDMLGWCAVASCSPMFRRDVLIPLPPWYFRLRYGDWPLYLVAAQKGRVAYIAQAMGVYRIHGKGMWSGEAESPERARQFVEFYEEMARIFGVSAHSAVRDKLVTELYRLARHCAAESDWSGARRFALNCLRVKAAQPPRRLAELLALVVEPRISASRARRRRAR